MSKQKRRIPTGVLTMAVVTLLTLSGQVNAQPGDLKFEVTITNITKGQILSPAVVASHRPGVDPIFRLGDAASSELAGVAEDAMLDPMVAALEADPGVTEVVVATGADGPILPGETVSVTLDGSNFFQPNRISLVGMLVTTNDAFYGLNSVSPTVLHPFRRTDLTKTFYSPAYDAGSEANNESCDFIPGPPCGNGGVRDTDGAEGFVHVHSGIHGVGDLVVSETSWHNPVASVTVRLYKER